MKKSILLLAWVIALSFSGLYAYTYLVGNDEPEMFENTTTYDCNYHPYAPVDDRYYVVPTLVFNSSSPHSGSYCLQFNPYPALGNVAWFRSPKLTNPGTLSVWYKNTNPAPGYYPTGYACWTSTPLWIENLQDPARYDFGLGQVNNGNYALYTADLSRMTSSSGYLWIACWYEHPEHSARILIDEMAVTGKPSISHTGGTINFGDVQLGNSSIKSTTITGVNLFNAYSGLLPDEYRARHITISVPNGSPYKIATTQTGVYQNNVTFEISAAGNVNRTLWIKYTPTSINQQNNTVALSTSWKVFSAVQTAIPTRVEDAIPVQGKGIATVTTNTATEISSYRANLNGTAAFGPVLPAASRGFRYSMNSNLSGATTLSQGGTFSSGSWSLQATGLLTNRRYYYQAFVVISGQTIYASYNPNTHYFQTETPIINPQNPQPLDFGTVPVNSATLRTSSLTWGFLRGGITATPTPGYRVAMIPTPPGVPTVPPMPNNSDPVTYTPPYGSVRSGGFIVYVWWCPTEYGASVGNIAMSSPDAVTRNIPLTGYCALPPVVNVPFIDQVCSTHLRASVTFSSVGSNVFVRGIMISPDPGFPPEQTAVYQETGNWESGNWSLVIDNLIPDSIYNIKAYAENTGGRTYSSEAGAMTAVSRIVTSSHLHDYRGCKTGTTEVMTHTISAECVHSPVTANCVGIGYTISEDGINYVSSLSFTPSNCHLEERTIYTKFSPSTQEEYDGDVIYSSPGALGDFVQLYGYGCAQPIVSQPVASSVESVTASLSASITNVNNSDCYQRGFRYSLDEDFHSYDTVSESSVLYGIGEYSLNLEDLLPGNTYYFYGYAENEAGEGRTETGTFNTLPNLVIIPTEINFGPVEEGEYTVESFQILGYGVEDEVEVTVLSGPFSVSLSPDSGFSNSLQIPLGRLDGEWTVHVKFTPPNKEIYIGNIRISSLYAADQYLSLIGAGSSVPTITELGISDITHDSALFTANLTNDFFSTVTARGFIMSKYADFSSPIQIAATQCETPCGWFSVAAPNLEINTLYYIKAYAVNGIGMGESATDEFNTLSLVIVLGLPLEFVPIPANTSSEPQSIRVEGVALVGDLIVSTTTPYEISLTGSRVWSQEINIEPDTEGNVPEQDVWVRFSPTNSGHYTCSITVSSLNAIDESGQLDGDGIDYPEFRSVFASDILHDSALLNATTEDNNSTIICQGFSYSQNNDMSDSLYVLHYGSFTEGEMAYTITNLEIRTPYYFRAIAENVMGRAVSETMLFTTLSLISISQEELTFQPVVIGRSQEVLSYTVTGTAMDDNISIDVTGEFEISLSEDSGYSDHLVVTNTRGDIPPTTIYVRFAPSLMGIMEGIITHTADFALSKHVALSGRGIGLPEIINPNAGVLGINHATCSAEISNLNYSSVTEVGAVVSRFPDFSDSLKVSITGEYGLEQFEVDLTDLSIYRKYYYKLFATNEAGSSYTEFDSLMHYFYTLPVAPPVLVIGNETAVAHDGFTIWWSDDNMDYAESYEIECWDPRSESLKYRKTVGVQDVGRIGEKYLQPGLLYDYRLRSDISEFSDFFSHATTEIKPGIGANTIIHGDSITYYIPPTDSIPAVPPFVHNNLWIDTNQDITQDMYLRVLWHPNPWTCFCGNEYPERSLAYYLRGEDIEIAQRDSIVVFYPTDPFTDLEFMWVDVHSCRMLPFRYETDYVIHWDHATIKIKPNQFNPEADTLVVIVLGPINDKPVTLSSFTATYQEANHNVVLNWVVESETEMQGYYVLRNHTRELGSAYTISPLINANNSSSTHSYNFCDTELAEIDSCYYWLQSTGLDGSVDYHGPIFISVTHDYENDVPVIEVPVGLIKLYPNPFNPFIVVEYNLKEKEQCVLEVYNIKGQLVKTIVDDSAKAGINRVVWNGNDSQNRSCGSGVYIIRMKTKNFIDARKVILLK